MSKPRSRILSMLAFAAFVISTSACASASRGGSRERGDLIEVQIINDLIPPRTVTVSVKPAQGGSRTVLGSVAPSQSQTFHYRLGVTGQDYVFTAEDPAREETTSRPVPLSLEDIVVWSLRNNQLELRG